MYPKYSEVEVPLLEEILRRGGAVRPSDKDAQGRTIYEALADTFDLSPEARSEAIYENGKARPKWENIVRWARKELKAQGKLETPLWGVWAITQEGKKALGKNS